MQPRARPGVDVVIFFLKPGWWAWPLRGRAALVVVLLLLQAVCQFATPDSTGAQIYFDFRYGAGVALSRR